jgi:hypothetical protein
MRLSPSPYALGRFWLADITWFPHGMIRAIHPNILLANRAQSLRLDYLHVRTPYGARIFATDTGPLAS